MNGWVYEGFDVTYKALGVDFDKVYYESQTYLLGKALVEEGLKRVFSTAVPTIRCGSTSRPTDWTKNCCCAATARRSA